MKALTIITVLMLTITIAKSKSVCLKLKPGENRPPGPFCLKRESNFFYGWCYINNDNSSLDRLFDWNNVKTCQTDDDCANYHTCERKGGIEERYSKIIDHPNY